MNNCNIIFIGLDTHKSFTQLTVLKDEQGTNPESLGHINTNKSAFIKLARQLQSKQTNVMQLNSRYVLRQKRPPQLIVG